MIDTLTSFIQSLSDSEPIEIVTLVMGRSLALLTRTHFAPKLMGNE